MPSWDAAFEALKTRDPKRVEALLALDPSVARAKAPDGTPLLTMALYFRAGAIVELLLARGVEPTPFELAILGRANELGALVAGDAALLRATSPDGFTLLHLAAHFGQLDAMRALLDAGADPDARGANAMGNMPLHAAAAGASEAAVALLLERGASPDARDAHGNTPLFNAAANGLVDAVELLLAKGADPRAKANDGRTPIDLAREHDEADVVKLLEDAR